MKKKCLISVRGRKEPIEVEEERGRKIKTLRFGDLNGNGKADLDTDIDLGDEWSGQLGRITAIEFVRAEVERVEVDTEEIKQKQYIESQLKLPPSKRGGNFGLFKISWWMRSGMRADQKEPPAAVMKEVEKISTAYFTKHPKAYDLPSNILEPVLVKHWGEKKPKTLGEMKRVGLSTDA